TRRGAAAGRRHPEGRGGQGRLCAGVGRQSPDAPRRDAGQRARWRPGRGRERDRGRGEGGADLSVSAAPKLRPDLTIVEQTYRGEQSFIIKDPKTRKYFRFRPLEVRVLQQFDGSRSAGDIAADLSQDGLRLSTGTVEKFAARLKAMGLLERTVG